MKKAFTLAEVLITLTIIGVIAALTIPNLMQSYKKHEVEVKVKEAYSILSNAIKISEQENGSINDWDKSSWNTGYYKNVIPYLKISKNCGYSLYADASCMKPIRGLNGESLVYNGWVYSVLLSNGMSLGIMSNLHPQFFVDINGPQKGKSTVGIDVFVFGPIPSTYNNNKNMTFYAGLPEFTTSNAYNLALSINDLLNGTGRGRCNLSASTDTSYLSGTQCSAVIARNGWKIPDNYPIKKF